MCVCARTDLNGDRVHDVIVTSRVAGAPGSSVVWVLFGGEGVARTAREGLLAINGSRGLALVVDSSEPASALAAEGAAVSAAGDVNGDGADDVVVVPLVSRASGAALVFGSGDPWPHRVHLDALLDGRHGVLLRAERAGQLHAAGLGDVNGDSAADLCVSDSGLLPAEGRRAAGRVYVVLGHKAPWAAQLSLGSLANGTVPGGFAIDGEQAGDALGTGVGAAGDINGDRIGDMALGARSASRDGVDRAGVAYVVFGSKTLKGVNLHSLNGRNGFALLGNSPRGSLGMVSGVGDFNGDRVDDLLLSESGSSANGFVVAGTSYVVLGKRSSSWRTLVHPQDQRGLSIAGASVGENSGWTISGAGDINHDSIQDVVIGTPYSPFGNTVASGSVVFGSSKWSGEEQGRVLQLSKLDGRIGFAVRGEERVASGFLRGTCIGDVNHDGIEDIAVAAPLASLHSWDILSGQSHVVFGRHAGLSNVTDLNSLGPNGFTLSADRDESLQSACGLGDINRDGFDDMFVTLTGTRNLRGEEQSGAGRVIFGAAEWNRSGPAMLSNVRIVYSPTLEKGFANRARQLEERNGNMSFLPQWLNQGDIVLRSAVLERLREMSAPFADPGLPHVGLVPLWHGTSAENLDSIFRAGYANLSLCDEGFFGKGIYSSFEARYAHDVFSHGALLINWVSYYSAMPVVPADMSILYGKSNFQNYDAHFAPVGPKSANPDEVDFYPCDDLSKAVYHELVVFEAMQCLPRYIVELQPSLPVEPPLCSAPAICPRNPLADILGTECRPCYAAEPMESQQASGSMG
eukprot:m51a1_g11229 hypothetical protein (801) ;mRNA; r:23953-28818